ncbi:MAG: hypothetical protein RSB78_01055 [Oscillospiraceae bacterium]
MVFSLSAAATDSFTVGNVGVVVLSGMIIVFVVLTVIYCALAIVQSIFTKGSRSAAYTVTSPFDGLVEYMVAKNGSIAANDVVMVISNAQGSKNEILAPGPGKLKITAAKGSSVTKGDTLFTIG